MNTKAILKFLIFLLALTVLSIACAIPFFFESPSMFYKTGIDKFFLRTGKIFGLIALILMFFQVVLISRFIWLEKLFKMKTLYQAHRLNGKLILAAVLAHPALVLWADHFVFFPLEQKYWPEFIGVLLLILLFAFISVSIWYKKINMPYKTWKKIHKAGAPILFTLLFIHVFYVSRTFESGPPFWFLLTILVFSALLILRKFLKL